MRTLRAILCAILLSFSADAVLAQSVVVPLDHQVYPLLIKGETMGLFHAYDLRVLPLTRTATLKLLLQMQEQAGRLSSPDAGLLRQMIGEFTDPEIGHDAVPESERHLYRFEEGTTQVFLDLRGTQAVVLHRGRLDVPDETLSETTARGSVRGSFGEHVSFGLTARNTLVLGSEDQEERFDPSQGQSQVVVGRGVFRDQATGYVSVVFQPLTLFVGRTHTSWGSGLQEQFSLSMQNEPMDQVMFTLDFERFRFSYLHANLQGIGTSRFLAGHRIDFLMGKNVQLGVYETVVYAGRGAELAYLNPFVPYHIIEHQLGDKDNNMFGFDVTATVTPGVRAFAEVFVDDFSLDFPLGTYWGNKLAYMAGIHWAEPFGVKPLELFAAYTRVDPYVYTHTDTMNVYTHYDASAGSRLGPNAERWYGGILYRPMRDLQCEVKYSFVRKGRGDVSSPHTVADGDGKGFLSGVLERQHRMEMALRYQFSRDMFLGFDALLTDRTDARNSPGLTAREQSVRLVLDINY
jgi:hypothetical protein